MHNVTCSGQDLTMGRGSNVIVSGNRTIVLSTIPVFGPEDRLTVIADSTRTFRQVFVRRSCNLYSTHAKERISRMRYLVCYILPVRYNKGRYV